MLQLIGIQKRENNSIKALCPYSHILLEKIKNIVERKWHPVGKHFIFPNTNGRLEKILNIFKDEKVKIDPDLQARMPIHNIARDKVPKQSQNPNSFIPPLAKGGEGEFEDLRRELLSRKYSYKTVKAYICFNRDFLRFTDKNPDEINDSDIKDYLLHLAEEKRFAVSTLNQVINALKFYYGAMLKRKFIYEVKRPRRDRKLPVVLSQDELSKILSLIDNIKHKAVLMLFYSARLRVGKVIGLKPEDIDSKRMLIHVKGEKGRKDRYTILSKAALEILRKYWKEYRTKSLGKIISPLDTINLKI